MTPSVLHKPTLYCDNFYIFFKIPATFHPKCRFLFLDKEKSVPFGYALLDSEVSVEVENQ